MQFIKMGILVVAVSVFTAQVAFAKQLTQYRRARVTSNHKTKTTLLAKPVSPKKQRGFLGALVVAYVIGAIAVGVGGAAIHVHETGSMPQPTFQQKAPAPQTPHDNFKSLTSGL